MSKPPILKQVRDYFDPPQNGEITYKYYVRNGGCHQCGACCQQIYLVHGQDVIGSVEQFDKLKQKHADYRHFIPVEEDTIGLKFKCMHLGADNRCGIYEDRPRFCRKYPSEETLLMGAHLAPECGFTFKPRFSFAEIMEKTSKTDNHLQAGKLLNDKPLDSPEPVVTVFNQSQSA